MSDNFVGVSVWKMNITYNEEKWNKIYYNTKTGFSGINDIPRKSEENVKSVQKILDSQNVKYFTQTN